MRLRKTGSILVLSCSLAAASLDEPLNTGTHRSPTRSKRPHERGAALNGCSHFGLSVFDSGVSSQIIGLAPGNIGPKTPGLTAYLQCTYGYA